MWSDDEVCSSLVTGEGEGSKYMYSLVTILAKWPDSQYSASQAFT